MAEFRIAADIEECRELWTQLMPRDLISDLWAVRECFHKHFQRTPHFIISDDAGVAPSLLPLCRIEESGYYGYFPGETWHEKTWLEQNRVIAAPNVLQALLNQCPSQNYLRYMLPLGIEMPVDEIGYLFEPPRYEYEIENYFQEFSPKSRKRLKKDLAAIEAMGVEYRYNQLSDFEYIADLSVQRFGSDSYFYDNRFRESFRSLMHYLRENEMMRITTVLIGGTPAAVDLGSIYNDTYTLLAGGTDSRYPGVAKLINMHHMKYACERQISSVDFLCGDFSWKKLFHLTPRPLYMMSDLPHVLAECGREKDLA
ncbi:MAG: GNAT family N-acetyltransferase [Lentisphaerae bacterium]|nr:GNAT family N-acetyltransferase [Lentisphaerota bacterium]